MRRDSGPPVSRRLRLQAGRAGRNGPRKALNRQAVPPISGARLGGPAMFRKTHVKKVKKSVDGPRCPTYMPFHRSDAGRLAPTDAGSETTDARQPR